MSNKPIIKGECPYCGCEKVRFANQIHNIDGKYSHTNINIPVCERCDSDGIEIRKINNRRYEVVGMW